MRTIHGEEYLLISKDEYNKLLDRIDELEAKNKEMHDWICNLSAKSKSVIRETISVALRNNPALMKQSPRFNEGSNIKIDSYNLPSL